MGAAGVNKHLQSGYNAMQLLICLIYTQKQAEGCFDGGEIEAVAGTPALCPLGSWRQRSVSYSFHLTVIKALKPSQKAQELINTKVRCKTHVKGCRACVLVSLLDKRVATT